MKKVYVVPVLTVSDFLKLALSLDVSNYKHINNYFEMYGVISNINFKDVYKGNEDLRQEVDIFLSDIYNAIKEGFIKGTPDCDLVLVEQCKRMKTAPKDGSILQIGQRYFLCEDNGDSQKCDGCSFECKNCFIHSFKCIHKGKNYIFKEL